MHEFRVGFMFAGLGAGAMGFLKALAKLGKDEARFINVGGVDNDADACADFEYLTGAKCAQADVSTMTPEQLRAAMGDESPDALFLSPPCKGFSALLSKKSAAKPRYRKLNDLVYQGLFLACETWAEPPGLIVLENVPRIQSRGKELLAKVRQLLRHYGYEFHEATHDCGEIGGLAQHRQRYLLVARLPKRVPWYVYRPPLRPVKACGTVLEQLPIPGDGAAGPLHQLPKLSWLNWVRLALIPAGGDWRDLPRSTPDVSLGKTAEGAVSFKGRPGLMGVTDWADPSPAIVASMKPAAGTVPASVADPRVVGVNARRNRFHNQYKVRDWKQPAGAVTGDTDIQEGAQSVADPRAFERSGELGVLDWKQPASTVTGESYPSNGRNSVADPRVDFSGEPFKHVCRVTPWDEPVGTITTSPSPSSGAAAVAEPLPPELLSPVEPGKEKRSQWQKYDVRGWDQPARPVTGAGTNGGFGVADPRGAELGHEPRKGSYEVTAWDEPARTVRGVAKVQNGGAAVADPRIDLPDNPGRHWNKYRVTRWTEPAGTVIGGDQRLGSGAPSVADPRVELSCAPRAGTYGVLSWQDAAGSVTGNARIDNGRFAVADPRKPPDFIPVIIAADNTWHRPLTTLELAALQGIPHVVGGKPLQLAGKRVSGWRERIGNAVPVGAGAAIAESLLTALLATKLGNWSLSNEGIWVRQEDGRTELELLHEESACA